MIGKRFRSLPFIFANDNYTLRRYLGNFKNYMKKSRDYSGRGQDGARRNSICPFKSVCGNGGYTLALAPGQ